MVRTHFIHIRLVFPRRTFQEESCRTFQEEPHFISAKELRNLLLASRRPSTGILKKWPTKNEGETTGEYNKRVGETGNPTSPGHRQTQPDESPQPVLVKRVGDLAEMVTLSLSVRLVPSI
jgi:hypothetical protein